LVTCTRAILPTDFRWPRWSLIGFLESDSSPKHFKE
jgi:hypothetical protein